MTEKDYFGTIGIPLSCTLFLEGALKKYNRSTHSVDSDILNLVKDWNKILLSLLKDNIYKPALGILGNKLINRASSRKSFIPRCIEEAHDVSVQSLHYALRFSESVSFLKNKLQKDANLEFCDLGCGLSPLAAVFQAQYNLSNTYCIDTTPEIADLYTTAAYKLGGHIPKFIDWNTAKQMSSNNGLNTIVSLGCLPHMKLDTQKQYLRDINKVFTNFFIEIKYTNQSDTPGSNGIFTLKELQKMRLEVENIDNIETAAIRNSMRYMSAFVRLKSDRTDFLGNSCRSLFLSR